MYTRQALQRCINFIFMLFDMSVFALYMSGVAVHGTELYCSSLLSRRYSRPRVRYSQLQQGPVQFTFTPGGQMVGDEEDEGAGETQMEGLQSDDDEKPLRL